MLWSSWSSSIGPTLYLKTEDQDQSLGKHLSNYIGYWTMGIYLVINIYHFEQKDIPLQKTNLYHVIFWDTLLFLVGWGDEVTRRFFISH